MTHVDNAADHHAWVVLRLLVEHVLGESLVSGGEVFRHPSVDPHALVLRHQLLAASHESLVLEAEPRRIQCHVFWDPPQLHWNASVHALHLIESVQATQHVNAANEALLQAGTEAAQRLQHDARLRCDPRQWQANAHQGLHLTNSVD